MSLPENQINAVAFGIGRTFHVPAASMLTLASIVVAISHRVSARYVDAEALVCCYRSELFAVHGQGHSVTCLASPPRYPSRNILTGRIDGVIRGDVFVQVMGRLRWGYGRFV